MPEMTMYNFVILSFIVLGELLLALVICQAVLKHLDAPEEISDEQAHVIEILIFVIRILGWCAIAVGLLTVLLILLMLVLVS